jgi:hypothetical protein
MPNATPLGIPKDSWRLSEQDRLEIVRAWERGEKGAVIAAQYGVDDSYPMKLARARGAKRRRAHSCCPHCGGTL